MDCRIKGTPPRKRGGDPKPGKDESGIVIATRTQFPSNTGFCLAMNAR
jgi:hypothetical protein